MQYGVVLGWLLVVLLPGAAIGQHRAIKVDLMQPARGYAQVMYEVPFGRWAQADFGTGPTWKDEAFHDAYEWRNPWLCFGCVAKAWGEFKSWGLGGSASVALQTKALDGRFRLSADPNRGFIYGIRLHGRYYRWVQQFSFFPVWFPSMPIPLDSVWVDYPSTRLFIDMSPYMGYQLIMQQTIVPQVIWGVGLRNRWLDVAEITEERVGRTRYRQLTSRHEVEVLPSLMVGLRLGGVFSGRKAVRRADP